MLVGKGLKNIGLHLPGELAGRCFWPALPSASVPLFTWQQGQHDIPGSGSWR